MKEEHLKEYKFIKGILGFIFRFYYHPTFENIPDIDNDEPIIVCGNHIHLYDQCLPILSTKRMLHYMAKKEYFDSPFAWFFKMCGCISVDRENHGGSSKEIALEILKKGEAIGIYPEGTRNSAALKEEYINEIIILYKDEIKPKKIKKILKQNYAKVSQIDLLRKLKDNKKITDKEYKKSLLDPNSNLIKLLNKKIISKKEYQDSLLIPIKYGTVSLASKSNATIVPYAITGEYKFQSKNLKITFGKPFKVDNITYEEANQQLTEQISSIIMKENLSKK